MDGSVILYCILTQPNSQPSDFHTSDVIFSIQDVFLLSRLRWKVWIGVVQGLLV